MATCPKDGLEGEMVGGTYTGKCKYVCPNGHNFVAACPQTSKNGGSHIDSGYDKEDEA